MSRLTVFVAIALAVVLGVGAYAYAEVQRSDRITHAKPSVPQVPEVQLPQGGRIVFRHTGLDEEYGTVAEVPLDDPSGARAFTGTACDRVYATAGVTSCLVSERGVVTKYRLDELDADGSVLQSDSLPGIPSRTRLSPDGSLVATTTFVSGHSYMQVGFSTATEIREVDGRSLGNLEKYQLVIDGKDVSPVDRNVWGVTFVDDTSFYATVGTGGKTYLVQGDLAARTLTSVRENAECPSISPDGSHVAYKVAGPGDPHWTFAVLDLATGRQTLLTGETRNVDDQAEWLDDDTLLYGMPRDDEPGVTDVWSLDTRADAEPVLLIPQAWSPSVVRP
jgi:dipeptidyl aminopeptidase/acylaminoacyl peptidase